jgi:DNA-binding CsgD family transcriptional regulator
LEKFCFCTNHRRVGLQITYDPSKISFDELLEVFWQTHDPTTLNRQGGDEGTQYRSGIYVSDAMASRMLEQVTGQRQKAAASAIETLTDRELEVLGMIGQGVATKLIAEKLSISARTVEAHRAHIKDKLAITDGAALVRYAVQWIEQRDRL